MAAAGVLDAGRLRKNSMQWIIVALVLVLPGLVSAAPPQALPAAAARPVVVRAAVDQLEPDRLVIRGKHFGVGSAPTVLLASAALDVVSFSDEQIVARLPIDAPPASYRLQVLANGRVPSRVVEVTIGGPAGRPTGWRDS
jgi:hypothetical protein